MPDWKDEIRRRLSGLKLEPAHENEIVEELDQHLEDVYQRSLQCGASEDEAKLSALRELANDDLLSNTDVDPASMAATVRRAVWEIDKDQPVSNIQTMDQILADSIARQRFSMLLLAIFAVVALVLAGVGIYGVMSYSVAQRTHEIGIRMALGAQTAAVVKLAVGYGVRLVIIGIAIGLIAAFALTRVMSTVLFGVTATDPTTFTLISLLLILVAAIASYIPARRATKVDPIIALRYE